MVLLCIYINTGQAEKMPITTVKKRTYDLWNARAQLYAKCITQSNQFEYSKTPRIRTYIFEVSLNRFLYNCGILFLLGGSVCLFVRWKTDSCRKTYMQSVIDSNLHVLRQIYGEKNVILA